MLVLGLVLPEWTVAVNSKVTNINTSSPTIMLLLNFPRVVFIIVACVFAWLFSGFGFKAPLKPDLFVLS